MDFSRAGATRRDGAAFSAHVQWSGQGEFVASVASCPMRAILDGFETDLPHGPARGLLFGILPCGLLGWVLVSLGFMGSVLASWRLWTWMSLRRSCIAGSKLACSFPAYAGQPW